MSAGPFNPRVVLGVVIVGAAAFLLFLYAMSAGWTGERQGGSHAASNGLDGYSGLAALLEDVGYDVSLSRSRADLEDEALLVLTPPLFGDGEDFWRSIDERRYVGPTLLVLPKWFSLPIPADAETVGETQDGWVVLLGANSPGWIEELVGLDEAEAKLGKGAAFAGLGLAGALPDAGRVQTLASPDLVPLVEVGNGATLAGYYDDGGYYPVLADAADIDPGDDGDENIWPLVIVAEPDLMNNYGMADETRAALAVRIVEATLEDYDLPIVFDLTMPGLGQSENLLTLAFTPPFLAATLCLILAALVIGWRAFLRFGPARAELPAHAKGKTELARNGAALVERARRVHLLGAPYASLVTARIARRLGLRQREPAQREEAIAGLIAARGNDPETFTAALADLRQARTPRELLRAVGALTRIERTFQP